MKRTNSEKMSLVYAYGCGEPIYGLEAAEAENERATILWDRLVQIERDHERAIELAAREDVSEIDRLAIDIAALYQPIDGQVDRARIHEARNAMRPMIWQWMREHKDAVRAFELDRRAAVIAARKATDAYWGNYNAVIQRYDTARVETRKRGRRLHVRDLDRDDGCLTVQIQRTKSGLGAAPSELQDGSVSQLAIGMVPAAAFDVHSHRGDRRRATRTVVEMRVDAAGNMIRLPMWYHRPLPEDCRVKSAQLVWRKEGEKRRYTLCLTVSLPAEQIPAPDGGMVSVVIAPAAVNGGLRVAILTAEDGAQTEIMLDRHWMDMMDRVDWLPAVMDNESLPVQQRIRARFERPGLWARLLRRRREIYRLASRSLAMKYSQVVIHTPALCEQAVLDRGSDANSLRHRACAHSLIAEIKHQCAKHGSICEEIIADTDASAPVPRRVRRRRNKSLPVAAAQRSGALAEGGVTA